MNIHKVLAVYASVFVLSTAGVGLTPTNNASAISVPVYTDVRSKCGLGVSWSQYAYRYIKDSSGRTIGNLVIYKFSNYYCAINYNTSGSRQFITAGILERNSSGSTVEDKYDFGNYYQYAGPVSVWKNTGSSLRVYGQVGTSSASYQSVIIP